MNQISTDIITIGDEILLGQTVDTNSAWMGKELTSNGFTVRQILSISDGKDAIITALNNSLATADLILITGGLGPTNDDITKHCLTEYFGGTLQMHKEAYDNMERFVLEHGGEVNENNRLQAMFPDNATFIPNLCGTASGMWFEKDGKVVVSMPGVPHEMKGMMQETVLPLAKEKFNTPEIYYRMLQVGGIHEAKLAELLTDFESALPDNIAMAYLPSPGLIKLRLLATGYSKAEIKETVDFQIEKLSGIVSKFLIGEYDGSIENLVAQLLTENSLTVSTAESCTGGKIAERLTSISGSSVYFKGSVVAYANEVKTDILKVNEQDIIEHGAVSQPVVEQMAKNVRSLMGTDLSIATSGIAGPTGGTDEKPVGTVWIAVANKDGVTSHCFHFGNNRERNIQRSVMTGLRLLTQTQNLMSKR